MSHSCKKILNIFDLGSNGRFAGRHSQKGFTLIEVLIAGLLLSILTFILNTIILAALKSESYNRTHLGILSVRASLISNIQNQNAWRATVNAPANNNPLDWIHSLSCLNNSLTNLPPFDPIVGPPPYIFSGDPTQIPVVCKTYSALDNPTGPLPSLVQLLQSNGTTVLYDSLVPTNGFSILSSYDPSQGFIGTLTASFSTCATYGLDSACPFRYDIQVLPVDCDGEPLCLPTLVKIRGTFLYNASDPGFIVNPSQYNFVVYRSAY